MGVPSAGRLGGLIRARLLRLGYGALRRRGRGLHLRLGIDEKIAGDHDALAGTQPAHDFDAVTEALARLDLARLESAVAEIDVDGFAKSRVEDSLSRNAEASGLSDF